MNGVSFYGTAYTQHHIDRLRLGLCETDGRAYFVDKKARLRWRAKGIAVQKG